MPSKLQTACCFHCCVCENWWASGCPGAIHRPHENILADSHASRLCRPRAQSCHFNPPPKGQSMWTTKKKNTDAHSFPPSSLDRRCFEFIVSPKKVVGCRGGSRNVERCWGFPYLKTEKFVGFTKIQFHTFWSIWHSYPCFLRFDLTNFRYLNKIW